MTTRTRAHASAAAVAALVALAGCAQTTVKTERETLSTNLPPPTAVMVYTFGVNADEVKENSGLFQRAIDATSNTTRSERNEKTAYEVADRLADELVTKINATGMLAQRATHGSYIPPHAVLITGHFVDIDEGNRLRRLVIGLGAGASKVDTQIQVLEPFSGGYRTLLEFSTHADSGAMPGAAVTMGAGAAAQGGLTAGMAVANAGIGGVKGYRSQVEAMAGRSADKAGQYLSEFFAREGWLAPDKVQKPLF